MDSEKSLQTIGMNYSIEYLKTNINTLLDDPNCSLENILRHEYILDEIKYNERLIQFFDKIKILKMIKYITIFPSETDNDNTKFLYPFISCEILSMGNTKILYWFFEEKFHLNELGLQESIILDPQSSEFKGINSNISNSLNSLNQKFSSNIEKNQNPKVNEYENSFNNFFPQSASDYQKPKSLGYPFGIPFEQNENESKEKKVIGLNEYFTQGFPKGYNPLISTGMINENVKRDSIGPLNPGSKVMQKICHEDIPESTPLNVNPSMNQFEKLNQSGQLYSKNQIMGFGFNPGINQDMHSQQYFLNQELFTLNNQTNPENNSENLDLKDVLFEFLNNQINLNPVLAGYFGKLIKSLILYKRNEIFAYFVESKNIQKLLSHINNESITGIIKALLKKIDNSSENEKVLKEQQLIFDNFISYFSNPSLNIECFKSFASIIDQLVDLDNDFIHRLFSQEICNILYQFGFNDSKEYFDISFLIISKLLKKIHDHFKTPFLKCDVNEFINISHQYLPMIFDKFFRSSLSQPFIGSINAIISTKFKACQVLNFLDWLIEMMKLNRIELWKYMEKRQTPIQIFRLIKVFKNVSMIHQRILKIFKIALRTKDKTIIKGFAVHSYLPHEICQMINNEYQKDIKVFKNGNKKTAEPPWIIFIYNLTEKIIFFSNYFADLKNILTNNPRWVEYLNQYFLPYCSKVNSKKYADPEALKYQKKTASSLESIIETKEFKHFSLPKIEQECKLFKLPLPSRKFLEESNKIPLEYYSLNKNPMIALYNGFQRKFK